MRYAIVIEKTPSHYCAYAPDIPDCTASGATEDDAEIEIRTAIAQRLAHLRAEGLPLPEPSAEVDYVDVPTGPRVDFADLLIAYKCASNSLLFDTKAYVCSLTGAVYAKSRYGDWEGEVPGDLETSDQYLELPTQADLGLGRRLVFRFVEQELPQAYAQVEAMFRKKGAFARFKRLLEGHGKINLWYDFEEEQTELALRGWCEQHGFEVYREDTWLVLDDPDEIA